MTPSVSRQLQTKKNKPKEILNWLVSPHKSELLVSNHLIIPSFPVKLGELVNSRVFHIFQAPLGIGSAIFANYLPVVVKRAA